jgi:hypothetical protein
MVVMVVLVMAGPPLPRAVGTDDDETHAQNSSRLRRVCDPEPRVARVTAASGADAPSGEQTVTDVPDIHSVAETVQSIVDTSRERNSATGYFAAMYLGVTRVVMKSVDDHQFTTPQRLVDLACAFAQRYIDAWRLHEAGGRATTSWEVAFRAAGEWRPIVLQHLLVGMNAHINLDLGIASAHVAPGDAIGALRADFDLINNVLAGLIQTIQGELNQISPCYRFVSDVGGGVDRAVINFSIARARAEAWKLATFLAAADPATAARRIAEQDRVVGVLGATILKPGTVTSTGLLAVRITEKRSPAKIIDILSGVVG